MKNLRVSTKLYLGSVVIFAILVVLIFFNIRGLNSIDKRIHSRLKINGLQLEVGANVNSGILNLRRYEKDIFINIKNSKKVKEYYQKWLDEFKKVKKFRKKAFENIKSEAFLKMTKRLDKNFFTYINGFNKVYAKILNNTIKTTAKANQAMMPYKAAIHEMSNLSRKMFNNSFKGLHHLKKEVDEIIFSKTVLQIILSLIIIIMAILINLLIARSLIKQLGAEPAELGKITERIANGDLTFSKTGKESGVLRNMLKMTEKLNETLLSVQNAAGEINSGSRQIAKSSESLSQNSTEQAGAVEEISSAITELSSQSKQSLGNSEKVNKEADLSQEKALYGNKMIQEMSSSMLEIESASKEIAKIIKTIDEIAFQTNLLALNAAVEAARAGRQGKGFAVVAEEVKNLSNRSAKAAKETELIINTSLEKVQKGVQIAEETKEALEQIISGIRNIAPLTKEISTSSEEQVKGLEQIEKGIQQIDQAIQQNAANSEENASASEELNGQTLSLEKQLSYFKLKRDILPYKNSTEKVKEISQFVRQDKQEDYQESKNKFGEKTTQNSNKKNDRRIEIETEKPKGDILVKPEDLISLEDDDFGDF